PVHPVAPRPLAVVRPAPAVRSGPVPRLAVPPMMVSMAAPPVPRIKTSVPRAAVIAPLAELAHGGAMTLRVDLPSELDPQGIDVIIQVRQGERTIGMGHLSRTVPAQGGIARLSIELKRG
ncbi:MAG TPA: hypothetical protein VN436_14930, partial [Holophaga sp.]|nr:hypothetical protein [Holophaga sp.]